MKTVLVFLCLGMSGLAQALPQDIVTIQPEVVFTPKGFDTNDNSQVVLYGKFYDICHKLAPTKTKIDVAAKKIYIDNRAYTTKMCKEIWVSNPYTVVVNLGSLPKGDYSVLVANGKEGYSAMANLPVVKAKDQQVDDFTYGRVTEVVFQKTNDPTAPTLLVRGKIDNTCLSLKEVKVNLTAGNVYDILPIMLTSGSNCEPLDNSFETVVTLANFPEIPVLLNVRSMGGNNIEKVIDLKKPF